MPNVLVVAFDGMDRELIMEFGLEHVQQQAFGRIDNHTDITEIKTGELFASFITGETADVHGVTGVKGWNSPVMDTVEALVPKREPFYSWAAKVKDGIKAVGGFDRETFSRENLESDTLFEEIPDSRSLNVPAYDVNAGIEAFSFVLDRYGVEHAAREAEKEFRQRKQELLSELGQGPRPFLMAHVHYLDFMNHLYGEPVLEKDVLREKYETVDRFAADILAAAEGYDVVIFMSDHGLPTETAHNEQAFYSCNQELGLDTPHITDFYAVIMELVGEDAQTTEPISTVDI